MGTTRFVWIVVGVSLVAACSNDPQEGLSDEVAALFPAGYAIEHEWSRVSDYQKDVLADAEVTFQEYEAAVLQTVQCYRDSGLTVVTEPAYSEARRRYEYQVAVGFTAAEANESGETIASCEAEYSSLITTVWVELNRPTEAELAQANEEFVACMNETPEGRDLLPGIPPWGTLAYQGWRGDQLLADSQKDTSAFTPPWVPCDYEISQRYPAP